MLKILSSLSQCLSYFQQPISVFDFDNYGAETRMRKLDWEVMKTAAVDRKSLNIVPSDYSQEDLDEYSNSRQPSDVYHRMQSIMDKVGEQ